RDREHSYALLDESARDTIHAQAARHFASQPGQEMTAARHALAAQDTDLAIRLAMEAAQSLAARHAHSEAAALLQSVASSTSSIPTEVYEYLTELYRLAGDYGKALQHARALLDDSPGSPQATRRVGELLTLLGELDEAAGVLQEARRLATEANDDTAVAEVDTLLAELHYQRGAYSEAESWATRALEEAQRLSIPPLELHARNTLGRLALELHDPDRALELFQTNCAYAKARGLTHQEAQARTNSGVTRFRQGNLAAAEADFTEALNISGTSETRDHAIALENLAVVAHLKRDFATAQARYYDAVTLLKRLGNRDMLARVANNLGELYVAIHDPSRARTLCEFATHVGGSTLAAMVVAEGLLLRGRIEMAEGAASAAQASLLAAREHFQRFPDRRSVVAVELARLALLEGDVPAAEKWLGRILEPTRAKDIAEVAILEAKVERAAGRSPKDAAKRASRAALESEDDLLILPASLCLARVLTEDGELTAASRSLKEAQDADARLTAKIPSDGLSLWCERPDRIELARVETMLTRAWEAAEHTSDRHRPRISTLPPLVAEAGRPVDWEKRYDSIAGSSPEIVRTLSIVDKVAPTDAMVLIRGESGTGKELVASAIHANSPRRDAPLVKVNCAALVETLLLSELFGHEKGAFTGAQARKKGRFELAHGGTIFLDEIGDISPKTQVALLRVLQEHEFERVGGTQPLHVDVRVVTATHRDLEQMVADGLFREDLYYRLRGVMIHMPALRDRLADLPALCRQLLDRIAEERKEEPKVMSDASIELLATHRWPGNIRELENVLRSATLFSETPILYPDDFAAFSASFSTQRDPNEQSPEGEDGGSFEEAVYKIIREGDHSLLEMKKVIERQCIARALQDTGGNITRAATLLGMKRPRLSQLVKQYGLADGTGETSL
ncbi:MAG: sigma 54-interacting transcriptional regulator, partial [Myxococcales bacterium]|nr:sigma 54-interacting transcriptional regulator [Myxococcales bacterium]